MFFAGKVHFRAVLFQGMLNARRRGAVTKVILDEGVEQGKYIDELDGDRLPFEASVQHPRGGTYGSGFGLNHFPFGSRIF